MQDLDFETGVWAVVTISGGRKYIGALTTEDTKLDGTGVTIDPAFEFIVADMPVQNPQTGEMGFRRIIRGAPVDACRGPTRVHVVATGMHLFSDMQEPDRIEHKKVVETLAEMLMQQRLNAAGIVVPTPKVPNGALRS